MVVPLLESERTSLAGSGVRVPPPLNFKPLWGTPQKVAVKPNPWPKSQGDTLARVNGLKYEGKVQNKLAERYKNYLQAPALHFEDSSGRRFVVPDGLLNLSNVTIVFEIKIQHMPEAWWQLDQLYRPVLEARNRHRPVTCIEIVRSYDPSMPFPCRVDLISEDEILDYRGKFGVLVWKL